MKANLENILFRVHDQWPVREKKANTTGRAQGCWPGTKREVKLVFAFSVLAYRRLQGERVSLFSKISTRKKGLDCLGQSDARPGSKTTGNEIPKNSQAMRDYVHLRTIHMQYAHRETILKPFDANPSELSN